MKEKKEVRLFDVVFWGIVRLAFFWAVGVCACGLAQATSVAVFKNAPSDLTSQNCLLFVIAMSILYLTVNLEFQIRREDKRDKAKDEED